MTGLFNYNSLDVQLAPQTKALIIRLKNTHLDFETLFELESILSWVTARIEVKSILISSSSDHFSKGLDRQILSHLSKSQVQKFYKKMQTIITALTCLPQTVIADLKGGADNLGAELALACDLKVAKSNSIINFNHLELGLTPVGGSSCIMQNNYGAQIIKNALFSGLHLQGADLRHLGIITGATHERLLTNISKQPSIARIQSKAMLNCSLTKEMNNVEKIEASFAAATISVEEWREGPRFRDSKEFKNSKAAEFDGPTVPDRSV